MACEAGRVQQTRYIKEFQQVAFEALARLLKLWRNLVYICRQTDTWCWDDATIHGTEIMGSVSVAPQDLCNLCRWPSPPTPIWSPSYLQICSSSSPRCLPFTLFTSYLVCLAYLVHLANLIHLVHLNCPSTRVPLCDRAYSIGKDRREMTCHFQIY